MRCIALAAMSIDGYIAHHSHQFTDWTSSEDKDHLHKYLDQSDIIIVGNNTYQTAIEPLSKRACIVFTRSVESTQAIDNKSIYLNPQNIEIEEYLQSKKYSMVAILGGTETYNFCLEYNFIKELYVTIEPLVFGSGISLFNTNSHHFIKYTLVSHKTLNKEGSILLHYTLS